MVRAGTYAVCLHVSVCYFVVSVFHSFAFSYYLGITTLTFCFQLPLHVYCQLLVVCVCVFFV